MNDRFLFVLAPYAVAILLPLALCLRALLLWRQQNTDLRAEWSDARRLFGGSPVWRLGLGALLLAHALSLLLPRQLLLWNRVGLRLLLLEVTGFLFGVAALVGLLGLVRRHLSEQPEEGPQVSMAESALLAVLLIQIVSGLAMAGLYRWASSWSAVTLTPYLASLVRLQPRLELVAQMPYLVKLHVFSTVIGLALLPWTRAVLFVLYPLHRMLELAAGPPGRLAQRTWNRLGPLRQRAALATSIWPEHED